VVAGRAVGSGALPMDQRMVGQVRGLAAVGLAAAEDKFESVGVPVAAGAHRLAQELGLVMLQLQAGLVGRDH
jgi:hypothetical protein